MNPNKYPNDRILGALQRAEELLRQTDRETFRRFINLHSRMKMQSHRSDLPPLGAMPTAPAESSPATEPMTELEVERRAKEVAVAKTAEVTATLVTVTMQFYRSADELMRVARAIAATAEVRRDRLATYRALLERVVATEEAYLSLYHTGLLEEIRAELKSSAPGASSSSSECGGGLIP